MLDGVDEPATVEELEGVVRRAGQRRRARLVAGAAALLAMGALGGALARGPVDDGPGGFAGGPQDQRPPPGAMVKPAFGAAGPLTFTPLLRREANGVAVRAYEVSTPEASQPPQPTCRIAPHFVQVELSNDAAVGMGIGPLLPTRVAIAHLSPNDSLRVAGAGSFGAEEGAPATWAVVTMEGDAAQLRLRVGTASDSMAPVNGKAALVVPGVGADGVVEALDANGAVIATQPLMQGPKIDLGCPSDECQALENGGGAVVPAGRPEVAPTPPPGVPAEGTPMKRWITVEPDPNGGPDIATEHVCGGVVGLNGPPTSGPGPTATVPAEAGATTTTVDVASTPPATRAP